MGGVEITALTTLIGLFVWYLKYTTKQNTIREKKYDTERNERQDKRDADQKEERDYYRKVIDGGIQKNANLNAKSIVLQRGMMKDLESHNGHTEKFSGKIIKTLTLQTDAITMICEKLNGGSHSMVEVKKKLNKDRRKVDSKVEVDRRTS